MSYKKKQQWYITGRSTYHHTNKPMNRNKHTITTHHMGEETEKAASTCAVVTNIVPRRGATRYRNQLPPEHLHHGTVVLKLHMHDRRSSDP
jgi:hypothetical protein